MQETALGRDEEGFKGVAAFDVDRASAGGLCSMTFFPKKVIFAFFKISTMASACNFVRSGAEFAKGSASPQTFPVQFFCSKNGKRRRGETQRGPGAPPGRKSSEIPATLTLLGQSAVISRLIS